MLEKVLGNYSGTNQLWLDYPCEPDLSSAIATVSKMLVEYTWSFKDKQRQGSLRFSQEGEVIKGEFQDTFHSPEVMPCEGSIQNGIVSVLGHYSAGDQTWGWRLEVGLEKFSLKMFNIFPDGKECPAVEFSP